MKQLTSLAFILLVTFCGAQSNQEEIPIFNFDDYYIQPKLNLSVGFRGLTGSKLSFSGSAGVTGRVASPQGFGDTTTPNVFRDYYDGYIAQDQRRDDVWVGNTDGLTNNWQILSATQVSLDNGTVALHGYSADIYDDTTRSDNPAYSFGTELILTRDMGMVGSKFDWKLAVGMSINGIDGKKDDTVQAEVSTLTDIYTLPPPNLTTTTVVVDVFTGEPVKLVVPATVPYPGLTVVTSVTNVFDNTSVQTIGAAAYTAPVAGAFDFFNNRATDASVLLGQVPTSRTITTVTDTQNVSVKWQLKGAYVTLRAGPYFSYKISDNIRLSVNIGPTFTYVGSTYTLTQQLDPSYLDVITTTVTETDGNALQLGYYVDTNLEYSFTERAGLYVGTFFQSNGVYNQDLKDHGSNYSARLDLSNMQGFRAGLNYKF